MPNPWGNRVEYNVHMFITWCQIPSARNWNLMKGRKPRHQNDAAASGRVILAGTCERSHGRIGGNPSSDNMYKVDDIQTAFIMTVYPRGGFVALKRLVAMKSNLSL